MPWWQAGAAVLGGLISASGSKSAANTQKKWRQRAVDEQIRQYDQTRADFQPWRQAGMDALESMQDPFGDNPFVDGFKESPGYQFRLDQGNQAAENLWSMKGGGGNAMKALTDYNQNMASNEFGNWWNRKAGLAGVGQTATGSTAFAGMNAANQIGGQYGAIGDNSASIGLWNAGNMNNALQSGISNLLYSRKGQVQAPTGGGGTYSRSDVRLKENITPITSINGVNIYSWDWRDKSITEPTVGVLAQEVIETHPEAVSERHGYLIVDYSRIF